MMVYHSYHYDASVALFCVFSCHRNAYISNNIPTNECLYSKHAYTTIGWYIDIRTSDSDMHMVGSGSSSGAAATVGFNVNCCYVIMIRIVIVINKNIFIGSYYRE